MTYTMAQIKETWAQYKIEKCLFVLKGGEWKMQENKRGNIDGTRAEIRDVRTMMGFPEYLEQNYK